MKKYSNYINILVMGAVLILALIGSLFVGVAILFSKYSDITKRIIVIWAFVLIAVGIIQLVTNKLKIKGFSGRAWGGVFIVCSLFLTIPFKLNSVNEVITVANNFDEGKKYDEINSAITEGVTNEKMDDIYKRYTLAKFENTIGELDSETIGNITYYYDDYKSKESIQVANDLLSKVHADINKYFKLPSTTLIDIAILRDFRIADQYQDSGAGFVDLYSKKLYIKSKEVLENMSDLDKEVAIQYLGGIPEQEVYFENVLIHEYTHRLTVEASNAISGDSRYLPAWFYEGMAVYVESLYNSKSIASRTAYLEGIENNLNFQGPNRNQYYERSAVIINYIIKTYGDNVIADIIHNINDDNDIYKSLEKVTGESFDSISEKVFVKQ